MKTNKVSGTLFYVAAVLFYLAAIINFASSHGASGVIWLALGSAFLCFGAMYARKAKKNQNEEEEKLDALLSKRETIILSPPPLY